MVYKSLLLEALLSLSTLYTEKIDRPYYYHTYSNINRNVEIGRKLKDSTNRDHEFSGEWHRC
jgi:hypothetical protein